MLKLHVLVVVSVRVERWVELPLESHHHRAFERIQEHYGVLASTQKHIHSIWGELHRFDLLRLIFYGESLKWFVLVVLGVEKMNHLVQSLSVVSRRLFSWSLLELLGCILSHEEACEELSHIIKASSLTFVDLDQALLLLVLPDSRGPIFRAT